MDAAVLGICQHGRPTGRLRHRAAVGRHDGAAAGHRLEDGQAEGLVVRRVHERGCRTVERQRLVVGHAADPHDAVGDAELVGQGPQPAAYSASAALPRRPGGGRAGPSVRANARSNPSQFL
jgi:hypothetical protein